MARKKKAEDEEVLVLTEWGCMEVTLREYGIDTSHIPGKVGMHMVNDFMERMVRAGYVGKKEDKSNEEV